MARQMDVAGSEVTKFWMVWQSDSPTIRDIYFSKADADKEAERLARLWPEEVFYVLKTVSAVRVPKPSPVPVQRLKLIKSKLPSKD